MKFWRHRCSAGGITDTVAGEPCTWCDAVEMECEEIEEPEAERARSEPPVQV